jgi:mRNA-degrading endonuclease toxin of MazEF toxin-antitoxin module
LGKLRDEDTKKQEVKDKTKALFSELLDLEEDYAMNLIDWYLEKIQTNKKHLKEQELQKQLKPLREKTDQVSIDKKKELYTQINKVKPNNHPPRIQTGDIVYVNFGQAYSGEIADGHYGVVIKRKGSNYLVAPLTKAPQPDRENTKIFENLNLPGKSGSVNKGYINFGQMKFVDYRRLEKVKGSSTVINVSVEIPDLLNKFNNIINS